MVSVSFLLERIKFLFLSDILKLKQESMNLLLSIRINKYLCVGESGV